MPREVRFTHAGNIKIDPNLKPGETPPAPNVVAWPRDQAGNLKVVSVCACGISATYPFCDGAHKVCATEDPAFIYTYDIATRSVQSKRAIADEPPRP